MPWGDKDQGSHGPWGAPHGSGSGGGGNNQGGGKPPPGPDYDDVVKRAVDQFQ